MAPSAIITTEEYQFPLKDIQSFNNYSASSVDNHGACYSKQLIGDALKSRVEVIDPDTCNIGEEDAFFIADLGEVYRQHLRWKKNLSRVKPHYGKSSKHRLI
ncbi:ornithine decarboxylase [Pyrenophora seminiperda CCB06]|uniref:Ornithine decarboxylase n=1 Tax=Pyrenophora seminiperda CCB06 TaxID=1302712 RepID=A0A3M7MHR2_9PLEO|nr:ornithine decarboxylase [Pyrenophora seminiperda CCB06]